MQKTEWSIWFRERRKARAKQKTECRKTENTSECNLIFGESTKRARSVFCIHKTVKQNWEYTKRKTKMKSEKNRERKSEQEEGVVCADIEQRLNNTCLVYFLFQVSSFHVYLCFHFLLFFIPPSWVRIVAKAVAFRRVESVLSFICYCVAKTNALRFVCFSSEVVSYCTPKS